MLGLMAGTVLLPRPALALADYSNDPTNPTPLGFAVGADSLVIENEFFNTSPPSTGGNVDTKDYVTFSVPDGRSLVSLVLEFYDSPNGISFVAIDDGQTFTAVPDVPSGTLPGSIAFSHFGTTGLLVGQNLLPASQPAGPYTVWIQQSSPGTTQYRFSANLNRAPGPLPVLGVAAGLGWSRRLRRRLRSRPDIG